MQFNKDKCEVLGTIPGTRTGWRPPACSSAGRNLGVLADTQVTLRQQPALVPRRQMVSWAGKALPVKGGDTSPLLSTGEATLAELGSVLGPPLPERHGQTGESPRQGCGND